MFPETKGDEKLKEISFFDTFKPVFVLMGILLVIATAIYLYSLTPQAIQSAKDEQFKLEQTSCQALIIKMQSDIPRGSLVSGADISLDHDIQALKDKGCIQK